MTGRKVVAFCLAMACTTSLMAQDLPQSGDVLLGLSVADADMTMELVRGPVGTMTGTQLTDPWNSEIFIQGVEFDNFGGVSHNPNGNILALNFGSTPDPVMMTGGGTIFNFATTAPVAAAQTIGDSFGIGGTITPTRMSGISVSPDNTKVAVQGYDSQAIIVYDYTAGDTMGGGAALSNGSERVISGLTAFDTQTTAWLDNDTVLVLSTFGDFYELDVTTMTETTVATIPTPFVGSDLTAIEYNAEVSPYVYAAYSGFSGGTTNELYVLDPTNNYNLVNTITLDFDPVTLSVGTLRDIALDKDGNLYMTSYGGDDANPGPYIDVIMDVVSDPASIADNSSIQYYRSTVDSGFNGLDVAHGSSAPEVDGDFNNDMVYDCLDIDGLVGEIVEAAGGGSPDTAFDLTGDGNVDGADLSAWLVEAGTELAVGGPILPGDANLDGAVDGNDFLAWNGSKFTTDNGWCGGDFNADGATDGNDFLIWNGNKFTSSGGSAPAVPEPATGLLGLLGLAFLATRRR